MIFEENQMGLFEIGGQAPAVTREPKQKAAAAKPAKAKTQSKVPPPATPRKKRGKPAAAVKKVSGLVPEGDVRLTANIRQDLHLKLKIASAHRRTTIGEILEELIEKYI